MKTMTVRNIDEDLSNALANSAKKQGKSVNQVVIETLKKEVGLEKEKKYTRVYHDLDHLFGVWSREQYEEIQGKVDRERKIDKELWE